MKENIRVLEEENEKNIIELNEVKQINMNLSQNIDKMKLNHENEIIKYKNKINEYENKLNEMISNNNDEDE